MRKFFLLLTFLLSLFSLTVIANLAQAASDKHVLASKLKKFEQFVIAQMAKEKIPGLSIGYLQNGVIWARGYGYADLENKTPTTPESSYRLASVTKPMTAAAILQLTENGKINLDAEVQTYVPYFPKKPFSITVRQLLGHLAGINAYVNPQFEQHFKDHKNTRESIAVFENFDLIAEPGTRHRYTSYGYNLLGAVIEGASGMSYGDYMTKNVWKPLKMNATRLDDPYDMIANRVRGYQLVNGQIKHSEFIDISSRFSAGGTRSNVIDMLRFGDAIISGRLLSTASQDLVYNSMITKKGEFTNYSAGWLTAPINGKFSISHDGIQPETSTYLFSFPSRHLTIAVAANLQRVNTSVFAEQLFEAVTGETWDLHLYIGDPQKRPYYEAMQGIFNEGRAYFERTQNNGAEKIDELNEAFAFINQNLKPQILKENEKAVQANLNAVRYPVGGLQLRKVGAYMAEKLHQAQYDLSVYSNLGAISFFYDYIALYKKDDAIPATFRFDMTFEQNIQRLSKSWNETRHIKFGRQDFDVQKYAGASSSLGLEKAFNKLGNKMRTAFLEAEVVPNYLTEFNTLSQDLFQINKPKLALQVGQLAQELYPLSDAAHALSGYIEILAGDHKKGITAFKIALKLNPQSGASGINLNNTAYQLKNAYGTQMGLRILQAAIELHPEDVNLHDSLGEFYTDLGMNKEAISAYQKALSLNPQYQNAGTAHEKIGNLSKATN